MRISTIAIALAMTAATGCDDKSGLVVRDGWDAPDTWTPKKILGRDYWPEYYHNQAVPPKERNNPAWKIPIYTDCAYEYTSWRLYPLCLENNFSDGYCKWTTNRPAITSFALADFFPGKDRKLQWEVMPRDERPFFINLTPARRAFFLERHYTPDRESYLKWKAEHPGFLGFAAMTELGSCIHYHQWSYDKIKDPTIRAKFEAEGLVPAKSPREMIDICRELYRRQVEFHFGDTNLWTLVSSNFSLMPLLASFGAKGLFYEATAQGRGFWQVAGAFLRGAARQFDVPYGWYVAHFYTGYSHDNPTKQIAGNNYWMTEKEGLKTSENGPYWGISPSLCDRQTAYGWLIGAAFIQRENAMRNNTVLDKDGHMVPGPIALKFAELSRLSATEERGAVYAPCAILSPISEFYDNCGQSNYKDVKYRDNYAQNAFFTTLAPPRSEDAHYVAPRKRGLEGCLFNSPYGEMYDVLCPDTDQPEDRFLKALSAYKCAFLVGGHDGKYLAKGPLRDYVLGGGTLFISADQVADGLVDAALAGVSFKNGGTAKSGASMCDDRGGVVPLDREYAWRLPDEDATAEPLLKDANGAVAAWTKNCGKGRIVTVAAEHMMPSRYKGRSHTWEDVGEIFSGKRPFEVISYLLARVRDETMPVKVEGDVQWGVNKLKSGGWRLWLINNKGITHFVREVPIVDQTAVAHVRATFRDSGKTVEIDVPPGEWRTTIVK